MKTNSEAGVPQPSRLPGRWAIADVDTQLQVKPPGRSHPLPELYTVRSLKQATECEVVGGDWLAVLASFPYEEIPVTECLKHFAERLDTNRLASEGPLESSAPSRNSISTRWYLVAAGCACISLFIGFKAWRHHTEMGLTATFVTGGDNARRWALRAKEDRYVEILDGPLGHPLADFQIDALIEANKSVTVRRHLPSYHGEAMVRGLSLEEAKATHTRKTLQLLLTACVLALCALAAGIAAVVYRPIRARLPS